MNKLKSLGLAVVMGGALVGAAQAADTSATVNIRRNIQPVGEATQVGLVKATVAATPTVTFDLPSGIPTSKIVDTDCVARDSEGVVKPLKVGLYGRTISATSSGHPSGTLAVGDTVKCRVWYQH